jgi:hypothetical protein
MAPEKLAPAKTLESDPSFMLLWYHVKYTKDSTTDWQTITNLMGLPTIAAM